MILSASLLVSSQVFLAPNSGSNVRPLSTSSLSSYQSNSNKQFACSSNNSKPRIFFLDVNPICYSGSRPSLRSFVNWISLFFTQVTLTDPVIAVMDGENGNEYRKKLMPSYKAHRNKALRQSRPEVDHVLHSCNVPIIKLDSYEADDVIATLTEQVLQKGYRVAIGSPDKDFKQLISADVQLVMPMPEFGRWSFYTLRHYISQYKCDPSLDLSLRCFLGDDVDGVPGIQHLVPGFGRKTALKLLRKHGSLENLLNAAAIKTVGKHYAQDTLTKYADYLRKNYQVLSFRRDANVHLEDKWLLKRDTCNDPAALLDFVRKLDGNQKADVRQWRRHGIERSVS